jgi:hypothetical protein
VENEKSEKEHRAYARAVRRAERILFKNNCVLARPPACPPARPPGGGFLCLITANCSGFTSIMARLMRRLT